MFEIRGLLNLIPLCLFSLTEPVVTSVDFSSLKLENGNILIRFFVSPFSFEILISLNVSNDCGGFSSRFDLASSPLPLKAPSLLSTFGVSSVEFLELDELFFANF